MKEEETHIPLVTFGRRNPWTIAFLILLIAMLVGFWRVDAISDEQKQTVVEQEQDRQVRRAENLKRDQQFCRAIPGVAVSGAQALINVVVAQAKADNATPASIQLIKDRGVPYVDEARRLALQLLPECPKILVTRPQDSP